LRRLDIDAYALRTNAEPPPDVEAADLTDATGDFASLYRLKRDFVCLIRPDGHVGFIGTPANLSELRTYPRPRPSRAPPPTSRTKKRASPTASVLTCPAASMPGNPATDTNARNTTTPTPSLNSDSPAI